MDHILRVLHLTPSVVATIGLACAVVTPFVAARNGAWIVAATILVGVTIACGRFYLALVGRLDEVSRRGLVFAPVAARITEAAWLYGFWQLGAPAGVVVAAGAVSFLHEYVKSRAHIAGLRGLGLVALGEHSVRAWSVLAGYGVAGVISLASTTMAVGMATGLVSIAATAWLLLGVLGVVQLMIVVSAALRS